MGRLSGKLALGTNSNNNVEKFRKSLSNSSEGKVVEKLDCEKVVLNALIVASLAPEKTFDSDIKLFDITYKYNELDIKKSFCFNP